MSGKKTYRTRSFQGGKRAAQKELTRFVAEVDGGVVAPTRKTVGALLDEWLAHIEHLGRSPSTLYNYRRLIEQLPEGFTSQQPRDRPLTAHARGRRADRSTASA